MINSLRLSGMFAAVLVAAFAFVSPANAQATRTWVSGVGDDANPCSRTAPCKTFAGAISKTAAGGEMDTLDPGSFGVVTITKAMTIASEGTGEAGIFVSGSNGVTVNCVNALDPQCVVVLRGLQIDGGPIGSISLAGVKFVQGKTLIIQNCVIRNFTGNSPNGYGVSFTPAGGTNYLLIDHSSFQTNGPVGGTGGNVYVAPTGSSTVVNAAITDTTATNGGFGYAADATGMTGGSINMSITNSEASGNTNGGVAATTPGSVPVNINVRGMTITNNGVGLNAKGAAATIRFGGSTITNNAIGTKNTGTMTTYGNNQMNDNGAGTGTAPTSSPLA